MRRVRSLLAPLLIAAAVASCSRDWDPVDREEVRACLGEAGNRAGAPPRGVPALARLQRADGVEEVISVRRTTDRRQRPWAVLAFFAGAERAQDAERARVATPLRTTRRQNVIAVFGRSDRFGRAPTGAEERRLQGCFSRAST